MLKEKLKKLMRGSRIWMEERGKTDRKSQKSENLEVEVNFLYHEGENAYKEKVKEVQVWVTIQDKGGKNCRKNEQEKGKTFCQDHCLSRIDLNNEDAIDEVMDLLFWIDKNYAYPDMSTEGLMCDIREMEEEVESGAVTIKEVYVYKAWLEERIFTKDYQVDAWMPFPMWKMLEPGLCTSPFTTSYGDLIDAIFKTMRKNDFSLWPKISDESHHSLGFRLSVL